MKSRKKVKILAIIAFILSIGPISWMVYGNEEKDITYSVQEEVINEGTEVILALEIIPDKKVEEISAIVLPDGSMVETKTKTTYKVKENGEYTFVVKYKVVEENEKQETVEIEKEEEIHYEVSSIQEKTVAEEEPNESMLVIEEPEKEVETYAGDIIIDETNFPDVKFRNWLKNSKNINGYGSNGILTTSEIASITTIDVSNQSISDLTGIEKFTALITLYCQNNNLTEINIESNINLKYFNCSNNQITNLVIDNTGLSTNDRANIALVELDCSNNKLTSLNINYLTNIKKFNCSFNLLTDLQANRNFLETFDCSNNKLNNLYFDAKQTFKEFNCSNNSLESLNLRYNESLEILNCSNNRLTSLDLSINTLLKTLNCSNNKISNLSISKNTLLTTLNCSNNQLLTVDFSKNTALTSVTSNNQNATVQLSLDSDKNYRSEKRLTATSCTFSSNYFFIEYRSGYIYIPYAYGGRATNTSFSATHSYGNGKTATISGNVEFIYFIPVANITCSVDSVSTGIKETLNGTVSPFDATNKNIIWSVKNAGTTGATITAGNVLNTTAPGTVTVTATVINGYPTGDFKKDFTLEVINPIYINEENFPDKAFRNWLINSNNIYGYGNDEALTKGEIEKIKTINVKNQGIESLEGIEHFTALENLYCQGNKLLDLKVRSNGVLIELDCSNNQLKELNIERMANLKVVNCSSNYLERLYCGYMSSLSSLNCSNNKLTSVDFTYNRTLTTLNVSNNLFRSLNLNYNILLEELDFSDNQITYIELTSHSALNSIKSENQNVGVEMTLIGSMWKSKNTHTLTTINPPFSYDSQTKIITSMRDTSYNSTNFTTDCPYINGNGRNLRITGTLHFIYPSDSNPLIPIENISNIPTNIMVSEKTLLRGIVEPSNATKKSISWSISDKGTTNAILDGNTLTATAPGKVVVTATIIWGSTSGKYIQNFAIDVSYGNPSSLTCTINGIQGKNGWYTSDVIVQPPTGYRISNTLGGTYADTLTNNASTTPVVYLKNTTTGALYSAKILEAIKIDKMDPAISDIVDGGNEITANNKTVTVSDVNLSSVLLYTADSMAGLDTATGIPKTVSSGKSEVILLATNKDQYFKIVAEDQSGRKTTYTYTLIAPSYGVEVKDVVFDAVDYGYMQPEGKKLAIDINKGNTPATITSIVSSDTGKFTVTGSGVNWTVVPNIGLAEGKHEVTLTVTYDGGKTTTCTVRMIVRHMTNPSAMLSIPQNITLEKVRNDETFEAVKEEEVHILETTDTEIYSSDFYIKTDPHFNLLSTEDSDEWFMAQIYNENNKKHIVKEEPLAVLNSDKKSTTFYIKAYKDIARKQGTYKGIMNFEIGYGEAQ